MGRYFPPPSRADLALLSAEPAGAHLLRRSGDSATVEEKLFLRCAAQAVAHASPAAPLPERLEAARRLRREAARPFKRRLLQTVSRFVMRSARHLVWAEVERNLPLR